ncbi:aminotransferase class I/II-fold pyridoxal phosphate-dependent enzyme [uncultured Eubacterium sp.]|uniref:aminotransferase class I/II-fold pyridoxal phosphate-dependent enzyme n=1 Tax=uncultured Eubacterium sp. TaxID=165185 RepID=UPI0026729826|nr:aminotransferase class I/II-fold pyridoxal phosphate-dependent enzyme [uncultured Eubacterium sp.]
MEKISLYEKLIKYGKDGNYPFHMPGHKRQDKMLNSLDPFEIDITEINGFDNLHYSSGIIKEAMDNASNYFGTDRTWFLVNGSTCGLLSAISAVTDIGDTILIGRNCHKAVYNIAQIRNLDITYVFPEFVEEYNLNGGYNPKKIDELLTKNKNIKAVIITSPTYDGILSDIKKIARVVHRHHAVLIVDEAHGAHLGISDKLAMPAYKLGADIVIESIHKTLPSLTQTALLHLCGDRVCAESIEKYLSIYQSSSPSYLFMAGIDRCIRLLQVEGQEKIEQLLITLYEFRYKVNKLKFIHLPKKQLIGRYHIYDMDITKLILCVDRNILTGKELADILREKYHFEMEMETAAYVLGITTICDNLGEIKRLGESLEEIDRMLGECKDNKVMCRLKFNLPENKICYSIYETDKMLSRIVRLSDSAGNISAEYIYLYPPEIPLIVPGELITEDLIEQIDVLKEMGMNLNGLSDRENKYIKVILDK